MWVTRIAMKGRQKEKFNSTFITQYVPCPVKAIILILKGFSVFWREEDNRPQIQQKKRVIEYQAEHSVIQDEAVQLRSTN